MALLVAGLALVLFMVLRKRDPGGDYATPCSTASSELTLERAGRAQPVNNLSLSPPPPSLTLRGVIIYTRRARA